MFGFLGLAAATVLDYLFKEPGSYVPIYYPIRLLGTIAGVALVYGTTVAMVQRPRRADYFDRSTVSDWPAGLPLDHRRHRVRPRAR